MDGPADPGPVALFAQALKEVQVASGFSVERLAERLHLSRSTLYAVLGGQRSRPPSWDGVVEPLLRACLPGENAAIAQWRRRHGAVLLAHDDFARRARRESVPTVERGLAAAPAVPPGSLPEVWNLPLRNPNFAGRCQELAALRAVLALKSRITVQALRGLGGVGKTQLAIEYAYQDAAAYDIVWWVNAEKSSTITDDLCELAGELDVPSDGDPSATIRAMHRCLRRRGRWLLIVDNAESIDDVRPVLPSGPGKVLITTRRAGFGALGSVLDLDVMARKEARYLIRRRTSGVTEIEARRLADRLGNLPLAVDQAASYLARTGMSGTEYLHLLRTREQELHSLGEVAAGYPYTVATVWSVSIERLRAEEPSAARLLEICAWFGPEPIPLDLFSAHGEHLPAGLAEAASDPLDLARAVAGLTDFSLARRNGDAIVLHRLVQDVIRHDARMVEGTPPLEVVLRVLRAELPANPWTSPQIWPRFRRLLPHILAATGHEPTTSSSVDMAWLLSRAGLYLQRQTRQAEAIPLHERAVAIHERIDGVDSRSVAAELNLLGRAMCRLGRYAEALPLQERALTIYERVYGPQHPQVCVGLNNVGRALTGLGQSSQALLLHRRALRIRETSEGPDHPAVATDLNFLGHALSKLGHHAEALSHQQRALSIRRAFYGDDHPDVVAHLRSVGQTLCALGRFDEALPVLRRALAINEAIRGLDHPDLAADLTAIRGVLSALGQAREAQDLDRRAGMIRSAHPDLVIGADQGNPPGCLLDLGEGLLDAGRGRPAEQ